MPVIAPTFSQIKAQVTTIRQKAPNAKVFGIRAQGQWTGDRQYSDGNITYVIQQCNSPLAVRMALREVHNNGAIHVIITPLEASELEDDILIRFAKRRLFPMDSWQIAKSLFHATAVDPRLSQHHWIADYLIDWMPEEDYPHVSGGFLDAETVWPILLKRGFGLTAPHPDLITILQWSTDPNHVEQFQEAPEQFRDTAVEWLSHLAGAATKTVLYCILHNQYPDVLPLGLVAQVLYDPTVEGRLDKAIGKLEARFLGSLSPDNNTMEKWMAAAIEVVQRPEMPPEQIHQVLRRADEILQEIGATSFAFLSTTTELGLGQRLSQFGEALVEVLNHPEQRSLEQLAIAHHSIKHHYQANQPQNARRLECTEMALRLARWLVHIQAYSPEKPASLEEAIGYQIDEGSFLDWARLSLRIGDPVNELSTAYSKLFEQVTEIREKQAYQFAILLQNWIAIGSTTSNVLPVEGILETIVAPLMAHAPILLIVMDGMGTAACRELLTDIQKQGWTALCQQGQSSSIQAGLSCIPSITSTARTSLLCGQPKNGAANHEKKGFASHPELLKHCRKEHPPLLFHKASLQDATDAVLSSEVRDAVRNSQNQLVGVIVNAIDDHLNQGEQLDIPWTCSTIKVLPSLLHEARTADRLVVLLSDHGHVLDHQTEYQGFDGGEQRWRPDDGHPGNKELPMSGDRVLIPESRKLITPWSERLHYKSKRNGYHGGISPQEMVIPIAILSALELLPPNWCKSLMGTPVWWKHVTFEVSQTQKAHSIHEHDFADFGPLFQ
ncbi:BREX-2 system phosphatase PglZ [Egbenema bharatensis]|uniref:BREX-2 system phosphatase PglZ n=1 Tax=Egbenema bharatensis TaxID=3463334 RepID=UPI003A897099